MNRQSDIAIITEYFETGHEDTTEGWFAGETWCTICYGLGFRHTDPEKERPVIHEQNCPVAAIRRLSEDKYDHESQT